MRQVTTLMGVVISLCLAACGAQNSATASASAERGTGGSANGDFGPPQGAPVKAVLTSPPQVPPAVKRDRPARVIVELEVKEIEKPIADGVSYTFRIGRSNAWAARSPTSTASAICTASCGNGSRTSTRS